MILRLIALTTVLISLFHGSLSVELFETGKEYNYQYQGLFTTGTEVPVAYASSYRLKGTLKIQGISSNTLRLKLDDVKIAVYNGKWSYFPQPEFDYFANEGLEPLQEPFQLILTEDGKFKTLIMNDQEPEFASNIKRGLATYLQINLTAGFDNMQIFKDVELTTMGECPTSYEISPITSTKTGFVRVGKFRNHADCTEIPTRTRYGNKGYYACSNDKTRDIMNSTSYAVYDIGLEDPTPKINRITVLSAILYWPFTSSGQYLYSWYNLTLALDEVKSISTEILSPENAESHEDLTYVFEQSDYSDPEEEMPDLKSVEPAYFHQTTADVEPESLEKILLLARDTIEKVTDSLNSSSTFEDLKQFHSNSPLAISTVISGLDYDSLKQLYSGYAMGSQASRKKVTELQLLVDGLMMAGTSASSLVIRDILLETEDSTILSRILPVFPNYIRNPSEALIRELDSIFDLLKKPKFSKTIKRMIEFSTATLVSRCCEKNHCSTSGILDKYIKYFEDKLSGATHFEEQTAAVLGLRNLKIGKALDKVLEIAIGKTNFSSTVRIQAIWSVRPLLFRESKLTFKALLEVFFDRTESCETRTSVFELLMKSKPDDRILHKIAYFMWSETCPQTINIVRSTLTLMSKSKGPCNKISTFAETILKYLPPGSVDPTRTTSYGIEYFDESNGIGQSSYATVQKSGKAGFPVSIYIGNSDYIGGFSSSPIGLFIRTQGLGKDITKGFPHDGEAGSLKILSILSKLKVLERPKTPLKLELTLLYMDRAILYYAADEQTVGSSLLQIVKKVKDVQKLLTFSWERSILMGEVLYQQPLEVGVPISILTNGVLMSHTHAKTAADIKRTGFSIEMDSQFQTSLFAKTVISNHVPAIGTIHSASLLRTLRIRFPRHFSVSGKPEKMKLDVTVYPPTSENPSMIQTHATATTSVQSEYPSRKSHTVLLHQSCPSCESLAFVSKGPGAAKSDKVIGLPSFIKGLDGGVNKFMCEKDSSKAKVLKRLKYVFGENGKNNGLFETTLSKFILGVQHARDYLFYWPHPEPCGFKAYLGQNITNASQRLEKIEYSISLDSKLKPSGTETPSLTLDGTLQFKYSGPNPSTKTVAVNLKVGPEAEGSQTIKLKGTMTGDSLDYNGVVCLDIKNHVSLPQSDPLGFEGNNEPSVNQTINIQVGKLPQGTIGQDIKAVACADNHVNIHLTGVAERSEEQVQEAVSSHPMSLPYLFCQLDRKSGLWPKNLIPPTPECLQVVMDQTGLRKVNFTMVYKVAEDVKKRWTRPANFLENLLSPYIVDPEEDKVHQHKQHHRHSPTPSSAKYHEGEIEIDANLRKNNPVMDVHFIGSSGTEQHFHDIDLNLLPEFVQLQPAPSRLAHLTQFFFKTGFLGSCTVTPELVVTFDNLKYAEKLLECETLISADCGESPIYLVSAIRSKTGIAIKIQIGDDQIEIQENEALMNSVQIQFDALGNRRQGNLVVKRKGNEVTVQSFVDGVEVRYAGGAFVQITLRSDYRGTTCGLCGNFDTTASNDLRGPIKSFCPQKSMITAWTVPSGKCEGASLPC